MKKEMILICDEQMMSRTSLKNILSSHYHVVEATNTMQAINFMKINYDVLDLVIVTDTMDYKELFNAKRELKRDVMSCYAYLY